MTTLANSRIAALLLLTSVLAGCATGALRAGMNAELAQDYDRAVIEYTRALQEHPYDGAARAGLERSRLRAALEHFARGRRFYDSGRLNEALVELELAAELNPTDAERLQPVELGARQTSRRRLQSRAKAKPRFRR